MTSSTTARTLWDRFEWVGDQGETPKEQARKIAKDLAAEPRHWNEGSLNFDTGDNDKPQDIATAGMAVGDAGMTGGGSNSGSGERWARAA